MPTIEDFNAARAELEMLAAARGLIDDATLRQRVGDVMDRVYGDASHTAPEDTDANGQAADRPEYMTILDLLLGLNVSEQVIDKWSSAFGRYVAQCSADLPSGGDVRKVKEPTRTGIITYVNAYPVGDADALAEMWREFFKTSHY